MHDKAREAEQISVEEEEAVRIAGRISEALSVFLSHFDLAEHLSEAYKRSAAGDTTIDTAFFHELEHRLETFEESRSDVFSDEIERAKRISLYIAVTFWGSSTFDLFWRSFLQKVSKLLAVFRLVSWRCGRDLRSPRRRIKWLGRAAAAILSPVTRGARFIE